MIFDILRILAKSMPYTTFSNMKKKREIFFNVPFQILDNIPSLPKAFYLNNIRLIRLLKVPKTSRYAGKLHNKNIKNMYL
jgi:hypothetical protein